MSRLGSLVGRDGVIGEVTNLLDHAVDDVGSCVVISGDAGVGKTAVLDVVAERADADGMVVLRVNGARAEANLPFAGLHQLVQSLRGGLPALPDAVRASLTAAFELEPSTGPGLFAVALATLELVTNAAVAAPLVAIVDDAHWLDRPTREVLAFIVRRLRCDPVVMVFGVRGTPEALFELEDVLAIELPLLNRHDAEALLDTNAPGLSPSVRARLLGAADGNPLALIELPKVIDQDRDAFVLPVTELPLSTRLERAFTARLPELPRAAQALLLVAASNDSADLGEIVGATGVVVGDRVSVDAIDPVVAAGLAEADDSRLRFRHPLVGSAIYGAATHAERVAAHRALADVLREEPDRRAWHLAAATVGPDESVAMELELVGERFRMRGAVATSVTALRRAASLSADPRARVRRLLRGGELACEVGQISVARVLAWEAREQPLGPLDQGRLLMVEEMIEPGNFDLETRIRALVSASDDARGAGDADLAIALLWQAASRCWWGGASVPTREAVAESAQRARLADDDLGVLAILGYVAPEQHGSEVLRRLHSATIDRRDVSGLRLAAGAAMVLGDFQFASSLFADAASELRAQGRLGLLARTLVSGCWPDIYRGNWDTVLTNTDEGERLAAETGQQMWVMGVAGNRGLLAAMRGEYDAADGAAVAHQAVALRSGVSVQYALAQQIRGVAAIVVGRYHEAYELLRSIFIPNEPAFHYGVRCWAVGDLAEAAVHCDRVGEARVLVEGLEPLASEFSSPFFQVGMRYARAVLAGDDDRQVMFERALAANLGGWPIDRARLHLAYGVWLRRQRRSADAREPLRRAIDDLDSVGQLPWAERARDELRASGETRRRRGPAARDELSPQELRIAQLAADGLTNREIGRYLYLSHRTVGVHLYRVFPKLGITSRSELGDALLRLPPPHGG